MPGVLKKYGFMLGLLAVLAATLADGSRTVAGLGGWLKAHHGPDAVITLVFFSSGLLLEADQIRVGIRDAKGTLLALVLIFAVAPLIAALIGLAPLGAGTRIGLFLVAVMPTTLSSGVIMTGAAGGNMAHALFITVVANGLAVFAIPFNLSLLLGLGESAGISIDKGAIMTKLALLVITPLAAGMSLRRISPTLAEPHGGRLQIANQFMILAIVWMSVSASRATILSHAGDIGGIVALVALFHGLLAAAALGLTRAFNLSRGRRESVIFMGGQKTLPLSVILQVSLFPQFGLALVVCVMHHVVHLVMDGYLVGWLRGQH